MPNSSRSLYKSKNANSIPPGSGSAKIVPRKRKASQQEEAQWIKKQRLSFQRIDSEQELDRHLCTRCRMIDFEAIFGLTPTESIADYGKHIHDLGQIEPFSTDIPCKLCMLFALIVERNQKYESYRRGWDGKWHLVAFTTGSFQNRSHSEASRADNLSIVVALSKSHIAQSKDDATDCIDRGVIMPCQDLSGLNEDYQGPCRITRCPKRVDYRHLKAMLENCDSYHRKCKDRLTKAIMFPVGARVIDCEERKIVRLTSERTYLALSYVWGPKRQEESTFKSADGTLLPDELPLTIKDAIYLTRALDFRYLWVDRYCVDQSHSEDTQQQVVQMANIYSHAHGTICSLGRHDGLSIPGVSSTRKKQLRVQTQNMTLSWTGPSVRREVRLSKWRNRGWTYQESVLSRKCLFFTDYAASIACESEISTENVLSNYFHSPSFNREAELYGDTIARSHGSSPAQEFNKHLEEFQRRQLSYVTDTLNAFKGILSQLPIHSYWGIPIYEIVAPDKKAAHNRCVREQEAGFIAGLCWTIKNSSHTHTPDRENLPTWSWVGQKHARAFSNHLAGSYALRVARSHFSVFQAIVRIKSADGTFIGLQDILNMHKGAMIIPERTQYIEIHSIMLSWIRRTNTRSTSQGSNSMGHDLSAYQSGENGWWRSDYVGDLHLDPLYTEETDSTMEDSHDNCEKDKVCEHLLMKSGDAILLALDVAKAGDRIRIRAVWLVVKQLKDGTYRRKGIIISNQWDRGRSPIAAPAEDLLKTIMLG